MYCLKRKATALLCLAVFGIQISLFAQVEKTVPSHGNSLGYFTRTIGYFTPVDSWNKVRREWEFPRRKFNDDSLVG